MRVNIRTVKTLTVLANSCPPLLAAPLPAEDAENIARALKVLADPARLRLLSLIQSQPDHEACVCNLTEPLGLGQPTVSHHLAWLRMMDLVSPRRQGKHVFYALGPAAQCDEDGKMTLTADDATVTITPYRGG